MTQFFHGIDKVTFAGADSTDPMAFHHYDPDEIVMLSLIHI